MIIPLESGTVVVDRPATCPLSLTPLAKLLYPPPKAPKSTLWPCLQSTPRICQPPVKGSSKPFCESPAISPVSLIQLDSLLGPASRTPRSLSSPFFHSKTCATRQSPSQ